MKRAMVFALAMVLSVALVGSAFAFGDTTIKDNKVAVDSFNKTFVSKTDNSVNASKGGIVQQQNQAQEGKVNTQGQAQVANTGTIVVKNNSDNTTVKNNGNKSGTFGSYNGFANGNALNLDYK